MRTNSRARRRRTNTLLLVGTFGVGIAMGFTLCLTFVAVAGLNFSGERTAPPSPTPALTQHTQNPDPSPEPIPEPSPVDNPPVAAEITIDEEEGELALIPVPQPEPQVSITTGETVELSSQYADVEGLWPARHLIIGIEGKTLDATTEAVIRTYKPGGVLLEDHNLETSLQARGLIMDIKNAAGYGNLASDIPLIMVEQDGGIIGNPLMVNPSPSPADLASVGDLEEVVATSENYAATAVDLGIGVFLAPTLNIYREGLSNPEFATQSFGGDPEAITFFAVAYAEGILNQGLIPVAKHFPGIGTGHIDDSGLYVVKEDNERALAELMYPFAEIAARHIPGILVGHVAVPALEEVTPPPPASLSPKLIKNVLRDLWAYDGVVIADDFTLHPAISERPLGESVVQALASGVDAIILLRVDAETLESVCNAITQAVIDGKITPESLANSKARMDVWHTSIAQGLGVSVTHPTPPRVVRPGIKTPEPVSPGMTIEPADTSTMQLRVMNNPLPGMTIEPADTSTSETQPEIAPEPAVEIEVPETKSQTIKHRIEKGESLNTIAQKYGVSIQDLMKWNNLKDGNIKYGYALIVNTPITESESPTPTDPETPEETEPEVELATETETPPAEKTTVDSPVSPVAEDEKSTPEPTPDTPEEEMPSVVTPAEEAPIVEPAAEEAPQEVPSEPATVPEIPEGSDTSTPESPIEESPTVKPNPEMESRESAEAVIEPAPVEDTAPAEATEEPAPTVASEKSTPDDSNAPDTPVSETEIEAVSLPEETPAPGVVTILHEIKPGEHLTLIANKYGVSISDIKLWNNMVDNKILSGMKLKIQVQENKVPDNAKVVETIPAPIPETPAEPTGNIEAKPEPPAEEITPEPVPDPLPVEKVETPAKPVEESIPENPEVSEVPAPESMPEPESPPASVKEAIIESTELPPPPIDAPVDTPEIEEMDQEPVVVQEENNAEDPVPETPAIDEEEPEIIRYKIEPGDTLFGISRKLNVPVNKIKEWNNLKDGNIKSGTYLNLQPKQTSQTTTEPALSPAPEVSTPETTAPETPVETITQPENPPTVATQPTGSTKYTHTVRVEQTLEGIGIAYEVSAEEIMKWNGLTSKEIHEGQQLTIYMPE